VSEDIDAPSETDPSSAVMERRAALVRYVERLLRTYGVNPAEWSGAPSPTEVAAEIEALFALPEPPPSRGGEQGSSSAETAAEGTNSLPPREGGSSLEKVWVVLGSSGQWSDWTQWAVCACDTEQGAKDRVGELTHEIRSWLAKKPEPDDGEEWEEFYDRSESERAAWVEALKDIDPLADEHDEPRYTAVEVDFLSSAKPAERDSSRDAPSPAPLAPDGDSELAEALAARLETLAARLETDHAPYWDRQASIRRGPDAVQGYYNRVSESLSGAKDLRQAAARLRSQGSE